MIDGQGKELSVLIEIHFRMKIGTRQFFFGQGMEYFYQILKK